MTGEHTTTDAGESSLPSPADEMTATGGEGNVSDVLQASDEEAGLVAAALAAQVASRRTSTSASTPSSRTSGAAPRRIGRRPSTAG